MSTNPASTLRSDVLPEELKDSPYEIIIQQRFAGLIESALPGHLVSNEPSKNIFQAIDLVVKAIDHHQEVHNTTEDGTIQVVYSDPVTIEEVDRITVAIESRDPGGFARRSPLEKPRVVNLKPIIREDEPDPEYPTHRRVVLGYLYDNIVRFTCWARTSKTAIQRLLWFEDIMEQYTWFLESAGVKKVLYIGNTDRVVSRIRNNTIYGYTVDYFVQTEKLRVISEKALEQLVVTLDVIQPTT
jgi:hypothetical protein